MARWLKWRRTVAASHCLGDPQGARERVLFKGALGMTCAAWVVRIDKACLPLLGVP